MNDEEKVWACICRYNTDAASGIISLGYTRRTAVRVLGRYPGRKKYHGHLSGAPGDGEHTGAAADREAAIEYLRQHAGELAAMQAEKKAPDKQKEAENRQHIAALQDVLGSTANLSQASAILDLMDPGWKSLGGLGKEYERLRAAKKASFALSKAK